MNRRILTFIVSVLISFIGFNTYAQSPYREASNNFAHFTQSNDLKFLEKAKKNIDDGYKTRRDSSNRRMIILRAMVLSSIAYVDSNRTIKLNKDAIDLTYSTVSKIRENDRGIYESEMAYIDQNLAAAHIYRANKLMAAKEYNKAYQEFLKVQALKPKNTDVLYNLALLSEKSDSTQLAIRLYNEVVESKNVKPQQYLELANLYHKVNQSSDRLRVLEKARTAFPDDKDILFQLIEYFAENKTYEPIVNIIDQALEYEPENVELNYLAGFAYENQNHFEEAKNYYENAIALAHNNYKSNLALGLLYLKDFLNDKNDLQAKNNAQAYLLKANEIKPYEKNALKSLAVYYKNSNEQSQLDRVNLFLNRLDFE